MESELGGSNDLLNAACVTFVSLFVLCTVQ